MKHSMASAGLRTILALIMLSACSEGSQFAGQSADKKEAASGEQVTTDGPTAGDGTQGGSASMQDPAPSGENPAGDSKSSEKPTASPDALRMYDPGKPGPYKFQSYSDANLADTGYQSAMIYYPLDAPGARPATTLSGGFTNTKEQMTWLGEHLASHGFVVIIFTPTNNRVLDPNVWATGHKASLNKLKAENQRSGSPIAQKVRTDRLGRGE